MAGAKIVVLYPRPTDVADFERAYVEEHTPLVRDKISGMSKAIFTTVRGAPSGEPAFHRIAEIHFPSMEALQASMATPDTQEVAAHAVSISTGGPPVFLVAEEETLTF
jgi:uncharacterized protein (TIGR02118 family)